MMRNVVIGIVYGVAKPINPSNEENSEKRIKNDPSIRLRRKTTCNACNSLKNEHQMRTKSFTLAATRTQTSRSIHEVRSERFSHDSNEINVLLSA